MRNQSFGVRKSKEGGSVKKELGEQGEGSEAGR